MNKNKYLIASSTIALALLSATPALADSTHSGKGENGIKAGINLGLGGLKGLFNFGQGPEKDNNGTKPVTGSVSISGTVTAINGSTLTLGGNDGAVYSVNAANAAITGDDNATLSLGSIKLGDVLKVQGTLVSGVTSATKIEDKTVNSTNGVNIAGTVAALNGSTLTITDKNGASYSVNTSGATINGDTNVSVELAKIKVGDAVAVKGALSGSVITATRVTDSSVKARDALAKLNGVRVGTVTAINNGVITINGFGTTTSVLTSGSTLYNADGSATTSAAVKIGSNLLVFGPTTTGANDSIAASVIFVIQHGLGFLKHIFR